MTIELGALIALAGCGIAVATFFAGRHSAAKRSGQEWGELICDVKHIKDSVDNVKSSLEGDILSLREECRQDRRDHKDSIKRLHAKWDEHEKRIAQLEGRQ